MHNGREFARPPAEEKQLYRFAVHFRMVRDMESLFLRCAGRLFSCFMRTIL